MEWISVKNKLPSDLSNRCGHQAVFVCADNDDDNVSPRFSVAQYYKEGWDILGDAGGYSCMGFFDLKSDEITHWAWIDYPEDK